MLHKINNKEYGDACLKYLNATNVMKTDKNAVLNHKKDALRDIGLNCSKSQLRPNESSEIS